MEMHAAPKAQDGKAKKSSSGSAHKALITRNLRLAYGEVAAEPLPEEWLDMLRKLDDGEQGGGQ